MICQVVQIARTGTVVQGDRDIPHRLVVTIKSSVTVAVIVSEITDRADWGKAEVCCENAREINGCCLSI